jgi:hypothetical protein
MTKQQAENRARLFERLARLGFSYSESEALIRIERALQRWGELECGDGNDHGSWAIERDEETDKPFMVRHFYRHGRGADTVTRSPIADREKGALKRLGRIIGNRNTRNWVGFSGPIQESPGFLIAYHQGDCRGCNLYLVKAEDLKGRKIDESYTVGLAVCC